MKKKQGKQNQSIRTMNKLEYESPFLEEFYLSPSDCHLEEITPFYPTFSSVKELKNPQLAKSVSGEGGNISRENDVNIDTNSLSASDSHFFLQREIFFKQREESFYSLALLVDFFESFGGSKKLHLLREAMMGTDIERLSVFYLPAATLEETVSFFPDKGAAKLHSFSFLLFSPVDKFFPCGTEHLSFWGNGQLREQSGIFRVSGIRSDKRLNLFSLRKGNIGQAIIAGISDGSTYRDFLQSILEERFIEPSVVSFSRSYFNRSGNRKVGGDDRGMKFIPEEECVLIFYTPASVLVGRRFLIGVSCNMSRIYGQGSFSFPFTSKSLGDQGFQNLFESFHPNSFLKDSKSIMRRSFTVGESTKVAQTSVESQFSSKMSLRTGFSKRNQKQSFEEANRVKSFSSQRRFWDKVSDKREIDRGENPCQGIILGDIPRDYPIGKTELSFHG